ncbi:hypothetical protein KY284_037150 [Solanum tuberosum]|nr:hypothetical protein KY284_037150 [Solanum tuberosum]
MWGGDMPNRFNHSAMSYADHQTANASVISSQSLEPPLYHETLYGSAVYYGGKLPGTTSNPIPLVDKLFLEFSLLIHFNLLGAAGPQSNYKLPGTVVGIEPWSNTNQLNHRESSNITWAIQGDNIPNSITDHTPMGVQPLNSTLCFEQAKLNFNNLIQLPLKELITDPEKESSMQNALSILAYNYTSFSKEEGDKIFELSMDFRILVFNWKEYCSLSQKYSQQFSAEKENIVATSGENELRVRYEELENKEKELITELEAVKKEKAAIDKQMKEKEERIMKKAAEKLDNLSVEWTSVQSFFIRK